MSWIEIALVIAVLVGAASGTALVVRSPAFWAEIGAAALKASFPAIQAYMTKRMTPELEKAWRDCEKRGGKWNNFRKRCE